MTSCVVGWHGARWDELSFVQHHWVPRDAAATAAGLFRVAPDCYVVERPLLTLLLNLATFFACHLVCIDTNLLVCFTGSQGGWLPAGL